MSGTVEEWDRRKKYLVRSLFDDKPTLSPIPELEQSLVGTPPSQVHITRPLSPLPELIIEKELNRHDEPEEYYEVLEKEVKIIYRKLFKRKKCSSVKDEHDQSNISAEESIESDYSKGTEGVHSHTKYTSISSETTSTFTSASPILVVTQAEVHQAAVEVEYNVELAVETLVYRTVSRKEETSSSLSEVKLPLDEPEIMRRQEINETLARSIHELNYEDFQFDPDITVEKAESFSPRVMLPMELPEETSHISIEEQDRNGSEHVNSTLSEKSLNEHTSSTSRKRRNLGIQTCFSSSSGENSWHDIRAHFFRGNPRVYKLCSCRNHACQESKKRF